MPAPHPAYSGSDPFLFISYSHADQAIVYEEICHLQDQGFNVWYDATGISAAQNGTTRLRARSESQPTFCSSSPRLPSPPNTVVESSASPSPSDGGSSSSIWRKQKFPMGFV